MTKTISFTCLHYGKSYLAYAIRSVIEHVDEVWIAYTPEGSHGFRAPVPCPETREELYTIAQTAAGDKLRWYEGIWPHEGAHRESIHARCPDADVILVLDSDEIWTEDAVSAAKTYLTAGIRRVRLPAYSFWRSFYRMTTTPDYPVRIIYPRIADGEIYSHEKIAHFGYSQKPDITYYKQLTHGHRNEWRQGWYETKFLPNALIDVHPTSVGFWDVVPFEPFDLLPTWMRQHPFANMAVIE